MLKSATDARVDLLNNKIVLERDIEIKTASLRYIFFYICDHATSIDIDTKPFKIYFFVFQNWIKT